MTISSRIDGLELKYDELDAKIGPPGFVKKSQLDEQKWRRELHDGLLSSILETIHGEIRDTVQAHCSPGSSTQHTENDIKMQRFYNDRDRTGKRDFAIASGGTKIRSYTPFRSHHSRWPKILSTFCNSCTVQPGGPEWAISADMNIGNCWAFHGAQGYLTLELASSVYITEMTVEHIPKELVGDPSSAPRGIVLWGQIVGKRNIAAYSKCFTGILLWVRRSKSRPRKICPWIWIFVCPAVPSA
jgi:hypothetical protein